MQTALQDKKWVVFFSRTGQEICDISRRIGRHPDIIVTNAPEEKIVDEIYSYGVPIIRLPDRPSVDQYIQAIGFDVPNTIVTLHGWLRIVPKDICGTYRIYNGHPGLITKYPDLKGFNPQEKAYKRGYADIGSVVHEVIPEVDEGKVLIAVRSILEPEHATLDEYYDKLRETSLAAWASVLLDEEILNANIENWLDGSA